MKQKWFELNWPKRILLLLQGFLILLFLILYCIIGRQQGIQYRGEFLRCRTNGEVATYSGKLDGQEAVFTVSPGVSNSNAAKVVEFRLGDILYGPYNIISDPTAVPGTEVFDTLFYDSLVGVEVRKGETLLFRGACYSPSADNDRSRLFYLVDSDGTVSFSDDKILTETTSSTGNSFVTTYSPSNIPGPYSILHTAIAPELVQRGHFGWYILGVLCCLGCTLSVLYADRLFRWNLSFMIADPDSAEPSEWELFSRWISWIVFTGLAIFLFCTSLIFPS